MLSGDIEKNEPASNLTRDRQQSLDTEWCVLVATREMSGIALKGAKQPTYSQSLRLASQLVPELFSAEQSLLVNDDESPTAREFRQRALAESKKQRREVSPVELIDKEMRDLDGLITEADEDDALRRRQRELFQAQKELTSQRTDEHAILFRDVFVANRDLPFSDGLRFREFELADDRVLRIRILHPTKAESVTGADLIYEHYWDKKRLVRVAALQYKVWENKTLRIDERAQKQLERMKNAFCKNNICKAKEGSVRGEAYRLPFCSAFLRPTDRLQSPDSKMITSGYHVPICVVKGLLHDQNSISSKYFRSETLSHKVFEELLNIGMVGSGWLTYEELEDLYRKHSILEQSDRIILHAQEYSAHS